MAPFDSNSGWRGPKAAGEPRPNSPRDDKATGSRRIAWEIEWSLFDQLKDILQRYMPPDSRLESMRLRRKLTMVRLRIHQIMKARSISAYALSKGANISYPSAYRLSRVGGAFGRLHAETLDDLCRYFKVQPGKLIQWVP